MVKRLVILSLPKVSRRIMHSISMLVPNVEMQFPFSASDGSQNKAVFRDL